MLSGRIPISKVKDFDSQQVIIGGFVEHVRKLKNVFFLIIRDFDSSIQVVFSNDKLIPLSKESVVLIKGKVCKKIGGKDFEITGENIRILSKAEKPIPIELGESKISEERHRMKYRYLDLRRKQNKENLLFNSQAKFIVSSYLHSLSFVEITTPILSFPSKEGAQTFSTVPNSTTPISFTLAQSPQIYKQLLMIGGFEQYFQFSTSFRAEKLREDRQFEFTQLDIEMAFSTREKIFNLIEELIYKLCHKLLNTTISKKFPVITYKESILKYGTDKPDLRNSIEIFDLSKKINSLKNISDFCFCILWQDSSALMDYFFQKINKEIKYIEVKNFNSFSGNYDDWIIPHLRKLSDNSNFLFFYILGNHKNYKTQLQKMGELRNLLWQQSNQKDEKKSLSFVWIVDWPYFEKITTGQLKTTHHPFTLPNISTVNSNNHLEWKSFGYDLVLNGIEIASGGERIVDHNMQHKIFQLLGLSDIQIEETFGWFLEALQYGVPPHLGIAIGWERLLQTLLNLSSIREIIAFPKNSHGMCSMSSSKNST